MDFRQQLASIARRLKSNDHHDVRHTLLDVADRILSLEADLTRLPPPLRGELSEIIAGVREAQPRFASHRATSSLFDREGLGHKGKQRARELALRLIALSSEVERTAK